MPQLKWPWKNIFQPNAKYNTNAATAATTLTAAQLTGGFADVVLAMTGALAAGANATTDTAANIMAAIPDGQAYVGYSYKLRIINESSGAFAWTVVGGTGVTVTGTASIAQNTWREFIATVTAVGSAPTITLQSAGTGTSS